MANCTISLKLVHGDINVLNTFVGLYRTSGTTCILGLIMLKISVGFFFVYIFAHHRFHCFCIYVIMILSTISGLLYLPFGVFTCAQFKTYPGQATHCSHRLQSISSILYILFTIITILGDLSYGIMGCAALWNARLERTSKISASLLLCFGSVGGAGSIVRLVIFLIPVHDPQGVTRQQILVIKWLLIDLACGVCAANLIMIKPLFQTAISKIGLIDVTPATTLNGVSREPSVAYAMRGLSDAGQGRPSVSFGVKKAIRLELLVEEDFDEYPNLTSVSRVDVG
ncbi:hypothetical protein K461DRAFT_296561 [Myriangium duriaei CBS 260.36]|uniref:Rhodopsin domain-containing protein n=1 Tax=Myriangium duriaei CBS 260.36 TaxID=1168546 RepID=A0A9P4J0H8_9PEZI|nr:hypothetical protein K461DRAFT_296561 [Myriangium duriaei CBS 260.36]